jgi:hypothetical protein
VSDDPDGQYFDASRALTGYLHGIFSKVFPSDFPRSSEHYEKPFAAIERELLGGHLERYGIVLPKEEREEAPPTS